MKSPAVMLSCTRDEGGQITVFGGNGVAVEVIVVLVTVLEVVLELVEVLVVVLVVGAGETVTVILNVKVSE
jgi:hypothetical protein